jgi:putative membrane protein
MIGVRVLTVAAGCALAGGPALAQQGQPGYRMQPGWHGPMMGWGGPIAGILMLVVVVAVLVGAVLALKHFWHALDRRHGGGGGGSAQARAILDERYARGEIDREEYLKRRADLDG